MRVLISDLDGTLVYVPVNWSEVKEALARILRSEVISIFEVLRWAKAESENLYKELSELIEEYEISSMRGLRKLEGSMELLKRLKEFDVKIAIVTLQSERSLKRALEISDLAPYVDAYVTRDEELDRAKQIEIALKKLNAEVGRDTIIFMGDRPSDLEAGRRLGIPTIIIGSTVSTPLEAMDIIADVLGLSLIGLRA
ncbi:MAG: HAD-IA family hydrolase [Candidatus Nezhaarchaeales archaeon]